MAGVTPDGSQSDYEVCEIVGRKEYEEGICNRQAKEWVDSIIITPHSQPNNSTNSKKRAESNYQSPKSLV